MEDRLSLYGRPRRLAEEALLDDVSAPYFATWYCTRRCNLSCAHCFVDVTPDIGRRDPIDTATARAMIDGLVDNDVYQLGFAGGEPFLRPDFYELAAYARERGLTIQVATNGLFLDDAAVERLLDVGFRCIQVSLDGATAESHDALRGAGRFDAALEGVRASVRGGLPVVLAIAVHRGNLDEVEAMVELAERESAIILKVQPVFTPFAWRGGDGALGPEEVRAVIRRARARSDSVELSFPRWAQIVEDGSSDATCATALRNVSILEDGRLSLCDFGPEHAFGDVTKGDFFDAWRQLVTQHHHRQRCGCSAYLDSARQEVAA